VRRDRPRCATQQIGDVENRHDAAGPQDRCAGNVPHADQWIRQRFDHNLLLADDSTYHEGYALQT
jgi:hypothetical protein